MKEINRKPANFNISISQRLYFQLKEEHDIKGVAPVASFGVIGKLIETIEKKFKSVELNYKGE